MAVEVRKTLFITVISENLWFIETATTAAGTSIRPIILATFIVAIYYGIKVNIVEC